MSKRDPKPEVLRLEELALLVKSGEIKLPSFQRPFVWKRADMLKLLDSIYKGYPIGSILLWNSSQRLKSERDIAGLRVNEEQPFYPTNYLLDGQQRLTTLCGAMFWEGGPASSMWNIHFDLETESFVYPKDSNQLTLFPLNKLMSTRDFIFQCMKYQHHPNKVTYTDRAERLLRSVKDYKIAVVKIGDMSIEEVAPIFERINSTGRKLTIVDLMMAATWSNGFDLSAEIEETKAACTTLGFGGISEQAILRSIAASANLGINKEDIQRLRNLSPAELKEAASQSCTAFINASAWIMNNLPVRDASYLPYGLFLTYLVEIFRLSPELPPEKSQAVLSWFWYTSATLYFGGASTGQISRDLSTVREFASGARDTLYAKAEVDIGRLIYDKFNLKNASSTTFALILLSASDGTTMSGRSIPLDLIGVKDSRIFSRLSPAAIEDRNISVILDAKRSGLDIGELAFEKQLLSEECLEYARRQDEVSFIVSRAQLVANFIEAACGCKSHFIADPLTPLPPNDGGDMEDID